MSEKTRISISIVIAFLYYNLPIDMVIFEKMLKAIDVSVIEFFREDKRPEKVFYKKDGFSEK